MLRQLDDQFLGWVRRHARTIVRVLTVAVWLAGAGFVASAVGLIPEGQFRFTISLFAMLTAWLGPLAVGVVVAACEPEETGEALAALFAPVLWLAYHVGRRSEPEQRSSRP